MSLDDTIRERIVRKLVPSSAFGKVVERGGPFLCVGCGINDSSRHIAGELPEGGIFTFHAGCFDAWRRNTGLNSN